MLIGLVGFKGSGKTTIANTAIITNDTLVEWQRIGFSDPIVAMLRALGVSKGVLANKEAWEMPLEFLGGKTVRYAAQTLGTEWGRNLISKDLWRNSALRRAGNFEGNTIIDNVRFPNEAAAIKQENGTLVRMTREGFNEPVDLHESERWIPLIECDYEFINHGTALESAARFWSFVKCLS